MKHFLLSIGLIVLVFSCENEPVFEIVEPQPENNFFALEVGNYWVYRSQRYNYQKEQYFDNGVLDSVSIVGTEVIQGETYFKFRTETTGNDTESPLSNPNGVKFEFFRELDGNLINEEGKIKFTNSNYEERLIAEHPWGTIFEILIDGITTINAVAGEFDCIYSERYGITPEGQQLEGLDRRYYANGVGLIYDSLSYINNPTPVIIRSLVSYNVQ